MKNQMPAVVLCADKNMEAGLHVTLYSLLKNYSRKDAGINIHLLLKGFSDRDKALLQATLDRTRTFYEIHFQSFDADAFNDFRSMHGNYMAYARLLLPDILKSEDTFLYLDSDLLVGTDIHDLFQLNLENYALGAVVAGGTIEWALDHEFFLTREFKKDAPYFNSGVLLFNAARWRAEKLTEQCLALCNKYPDQLTSHDQTVLNYVFNKKVLELNNCYNVPCYPTTGEPISEEQARRQITHFVGSPKPWDIFGNILHPNRRLYGKYFDETALQGRTGFHPENLFRALKLSRSYFRCISAKYKS